MGESAQALSTIQGIGSLVQAGGSLAYSLSQGSAARAKGQYEKGQYDFNNKIAEFQAEDAIRRGEKAASAKRKETKQIIGAQRASFAAQGLDISVGSPLEVQYDTKHIGEIDALTIKNNSWQEAWGYKVQALNYSAAGKFAENAGNFSYSNMLLAGGLNAGRYGLEAASYFGGGGKTPKTDSGSPSSPRDYGGMGKTVSRGTY